MEKWKMGKKMGKEYLNSKMEIAMKDNISMGRERDWGYTIMPMEIHMKENSKMINEKERAFSIIIMASLKKESIGKGFPMEKQYIMARIEKKNHTENIIMGKKYHRFLCDCDKINEYRYKVFG